MKITKIGHCCLLIETRGKKILTDPGSFTADKNSQIDNLDYILFTHEHQDHFHLESLKEILVKNSNVEVFANTSVSALLEKEGIAHKTILHKQEVLLGGVKVLGFGEKHAEMHSSIPLSANTGFFIDDRLWYPGDSFVNPERKVEILALPVSGPWMKIGEAVDYALLLKPKTAFPVHDYIRFGSAHLFPPKILAGEGINFIPLAEGQSFEF